VRNLSACRDADPHRRACQHYPPFDLSLGDRASVAVAIEHKATVETAERTWKNLNIGVANEVIR